MRKLFSLVALVLAPFAIGQPLPPPLATRAQALAGTNNFSYMSPLRTAQAIAAGGGGGGSGTVTSVGWTGGIVSVATATTTPAFTIAGTSGGIPFFSSTSTWASSGLLTANAIVIGGGAGAAPSTTTTGTGVLTALGVNVGSAGAFVVYGGVGNFSAVTDSGLTSGRVPFASTGGLLTDASTLTFNSGTGAFTATSFSGAGTGLTGTAASLTAGTASAVAVGGITGLGTGVGTALAVNVGSAGAFVTYNGAGGAPSSLTIPSNATATTASVGDADTSPATTGFVNTAAVPTPNAQTGTTYTLVLADGYPGSNFITLSNAAAITLTVPTNASVAFPTNTQIAIQQIGAGAVTVAPAGGVTINSPGSLLTLGGQYQSAVLIKTGTNTWTLTGSLSLSTLTTQTVAAGTAYTMTASAADLDFGTTDPVVTLGAAGTYLISANVQTNFSGATYAAFQSATFNLRRSNNTAADVSGSTFGAILPIATTITVIGPTVTVAAIKYTTANTNDTVTIRGILSAAPSAGSVTITNATITAQYVGP